MQSMYEAKKDLQKSLNEINAWVGNCKSQIINKKYQQILQKSRSFVFCTTSQQKIINFDIKIESRKRLKSFQGNHGKYWKFQPWKFVRTFSFYFWAIASFAGRRQ